MPNNGSTATVRIGERLLPVVPQKHARLRHQLTAADFQSIASRNYGPESYRVLTILIPALKDMPEWEWDGFRTEERWERYKAGDRDAYDENDDPSPTTAEIVTAFETALNVSGADRLGKLLKLLTAANSAVDVGAGTPTPPSPVPPGPTGESPSTSSGTSPLTSIPNVG